MLYALIAMKESDASAKKRGYALTGLIYQALPMGAAPIGHEMIIDLKEVPCEEVDMEETNAYYFSLEGVSEYPSLNEADKEIMDTVIEKLGKMSKDQIVSFMHNEQAYAETAPRDIIQYKYAVSLQI